MTFILDTGNNIFKSCLQKDVIVILNPLLLVLFSVLMVVALKSFLDWNALYPVYLLFIMMVGFMASLVSHILVIKGFLEFKWRLFSSLVLNNVVYDFFLLPSFSLLLVVWAQQTGYPWLFAILFSGFTTLQDYLIERYTDMLDFKRWTLVHSAIGSGIGFLLWYLFYSWLHHHYG